MDRVDPAESDAEEHGRFILLYHLLATKVELLAWAFDQAYGADYARRIMRDPMQFGTPDLRFRGSRTSTRSRPGSSDRREPDRGPFAVATGVSGRGAERDP
jgi:hypothetical protein